MVIYATKSYCLRIGPETVLNVPIFSKSTNIETVKLVKNFSVSSYLQLSERKMICEIQFQESTRPTKS